MSKEYQWTQADKTPELDALANAQGIDQAEKLDALERLKKSWLADPCWDIEDTEGFEEYKAELLAFRKAEEKKWDEKEQERKKRRSKKVGSWTGIWNDDLADVLSTPDEIENELNRLNGQIGDAGSASEYAQFVIAREQVRATLLLAAQVQRVAELLGRKIDDDAGDNNVRFMTDLYKTD